MLRQILTCFAVGGFAFLASCDSKSTDSNPEGSGNPSSITSIPWNTSITYGTLTDSRDGKSYKTVTIGTQVWMAENLNYQVVGSWWYGNSADNGAMYGRLYTWAAAMKLPPSCDSSFCVGQVQPKHQGVCPNGWHVPSDSEWSSLSAYLGGDATSGGKLKSSSVWSYEGVPGNDPDAYGFRALPAGYRFLDGDFYNMGNDASFWSSSEISTDDAWYRNLYSGNNILRRHGLSKKNTASIRCIKDLP